MRAALILMVAFVLLALAGCSDAPEQEAPPPEHARGNCEPHTKTIEGFVVEVERIGGLGPDGPIRSSWEGATVVADGPVHVEAVTDADGCALLEVLESGTYEFFVQVDEDDGCRPTGQVTKREWSARTQWVPLHYSDPCA